MVGKDALVCLLTESIDQAVLDAAGPSLKVVANVAVGFNNIDVPPAGRAASSSPTRPDVLTNACADFTWALILAVTRRLGEGERELRDGRWKGWALDHLLGMELRGKQLGLVGMGRIARAVADKAPAFGMSVAYTDQVVTDVPGATAMSLDRLLATSDVLSLHVNLTPQTTRLIDQKALVKMRRSAYLINTSRGPVVDEAALAWALRERVIRRCRARRLREGAGGARGLCSARERLLIPHLASATTETRTAMADLAVSNVLAVLDGRPALTPVP